MAQTRQREADIFAELPTAQDLMKQITLREAAKATKDFRSQSAEETEKKALIDKLAKPSGVSDEERLSRAIAIIKRAANNGRTEVEIGRFPNQLCTDRGRAINQQEQGWETTLTGVPKELFNFWSQFLKPRGYKLRMQVVDFPNGVPGDIGISLSWGGK